MDDDSQPRSRAHDTAVDPVTHRFPPAFAASFGGDSPDSPDDSGELELNTGVMENVREVLEGRLELEDIEEHIDIERSVRPPVRALEGGTVVTRRPARPIDFGLGSGGTVVARAPSQPAVLRGGTVVAPNPLLRARAPQPASPLRVAILGHYLKPQQPVWVTPPVGHDVLEIGRQAALLWAVDPYIEPQHLALRPVDGGVQLEDRSSTNGVFMKINAPFVLREPHQFRIGRHLLAVETVLLDPTREHVRPIGSPNPGYWGRLNVLISPRQPAACIPLRSTEIVLSTVEGPLSFVDDDAISRQHAKLRWKDGRISIEDTNSRHGTFVRMQSSDVVPFGSLLLVGQTLICVAATS